MGESYLHFIYTRREIVHSRYTWAHTGPFQTVSYPNPNRFTLDVTVHTDSVHFYSVTVDETRRCTRFDLRPLTKLDEVWGGSGDEVQILTDFTLRF